MISKWKIFLVVVCINLFYGKLAADNFMTLKYNHAFSYSLSCTFYAIYFGLFSYIQTFFFSKKYNLFLTAILLIPIAYLLGALCWEISIPIAIPESPLNKFRDYTSSPYSDFYYIMWGTFVGSFIITFHAFWGTVSTLSYVILNIMFKLIKKYRLKT